MAEFVQLGKGRWLKIITSGVVSAIPIKNATDINAFASTSVQWDTGSMVTCISERLVANKYG